MNPAETDSSTSVACRVGAPASTAERDVPRRLLEWVPGFLGATAMVFGCLHLLLFLNMTSGAGLVVIGGFPTFMPSEAAADPALGLAVSGTGFLAIGWALTQRMEAAYLVIQFLLGLGILDFLRGTLGWAELLPVSAAFVLLLPARKVFYRLALPAAWAFPLSGLLSAVAGGALGVWLAIGESKPVGGVVGSVAGMAVAFFVQVLRPARAPLSRPTSQDLARAAAIVRAGRRGAANLVFLGDKAIRFSQSGHGYLMFAIRGRSWVAMGDPVGPPEAQRELAWWLRAEAAHHGGLPAFYQIGDENLPLYIDLGLSLYKLGEEAVVPLEHFSLEGSHRRGLRRIQRDVLKAKASFALVPPEGVHGLLPEMRQVSDQWLAHKETREKRFSLGRFDEDYLQRFPLATVRVASRLVAFANLWAAPVGGELAIDVMRYGTDAPRGVMSYLFIELMLWGQAQGYRTFNLGMAPFAGLENRALAPLWNRAGALLFHHGNRFYNFEGLREYKSRFDPLWRPRYLASPTGLALPQVLANVASLVAGGFIGVLAR